MHVFKKVIADVQGIVIAIVNKIEHVDKGRYEAGHGFDLGLKFNRHGRGFNLID